MERKRKRDVFLFHFLLVLSIKCFFKDKKGDVVVIVDGVVLAMAFVFS